MTDHYIVYQGLENLPRRGFMRIGIPDASVIEAKIIPGLKGEPPIYVRWHQRELEGIRLRLLTYTYKEMEEREVEELLLKALSFVQGSG